MFVSKEQRKTVNKITNLTNVIGEGSVIEGNIETIGNIRIEGKVIGDIKSKAKIVLGQKGYIQGNIVSTNADLEGKLKGRVEIVETLILKATSTVHGDVITSKLVVEPGASFNGGCKMGGGLVRDIKMEGSEKAEDSSKRRSYNSF